MSASRLAAAAIKIPKRIERGPTDILRALASTVKNLPSEPEYMLHDDPYLLPTRPLERGSKASKDPLDKETIKESRLMDKNVYMMARLSGKSTAKFLLNKHPEMFYRDDAEPKIRCFLPPEEFREDMVFDESDIKWCIENNDPVNAVIAYRALEKANVTLTKETLLDFFELLCYTNEEKLLELLDFQKEFFTKNSERQLVNQTWNTNGLASKIFNQLKEDPEAPRIYSAMIAGLSKFNEHAAAKQVFEDFKEFHPNEGLYTAAYNGLINSIPNLHSSQESAHEAIGDLVKHMETHLVKPDLMVFNSILTVYWRFMIDDSILRNAFKLVNDMRSLEIEPSLYTYHCIIKLMCKRRSRTSHLATIGDILDYIISNAGTDLMTVKDERDLQFLNETMRTIVNQLHNLPLAKKLHRIYMLQPNLFASEGTKQRYLDTYFRLIVTTDSMDEIRDFYTTYVPGKFRPSQDTNDVLIEALDLYKVDENNSCSDNTQP